MTVSQVLKRYGPEYLKAFAKTMTAQQKKVLRAVIACRDESLGTVRYACVNCHHEHTLPRSCCNRHCPACQHEALQRWLAQQQGRLLPCGYFLITFTVPREVRAAFQQFPAEGYAAMMSCAAEALKEAAKNPRHVGATECGFFGVLHTWGRDLSYHPHGHFIVPAGGLDANGAWTSSRASLFVPTQILAILFRNKLRDRLRNNKRKRNVGPSGDGDRSRDGGSETQDGDSDAGSCYDAIPAWVWKRSWTVDSKAVGDGKRALTYLAPYVMRGAVANWRVSECAGKDVRKSANTAANSSAKESVGTSSRDGPVAVAPEEQSQGSLHTAKVVLQVKRSGSRRYRGMELSVVDFIRRWLHHVLPQGLHRVRHYGFMHSSSRHELGELKWLVAIALCDLYYLTCTESIVQAARSRMRCPQCGGAMVLLGYVEPNLDDPTIGQLTLGTATWSFGSRLSSRAPP